jgi:DNA replication protein DnaC
MAASNPIPEGFQPYFDRCEAHGRYQQNFADANGTERFFPGCPKCAQEAHMRRMLDRAAIPPRFLDRRLETYRADLPGQKRALTIAQEYAEQFADALKSGRCLTFVGKPGAGKTHLACAIAHEVMRQGYSALFLTVSELIRMIRSTWGKAAKRTEEEVLQSLCAVDLLILDEVGMQYGTEAEQVQLFEVINRRYANLRPMLVLSNLPAESTERDTPSLRAFLGDRGFDRLREGGGRLVIFDWDSYRRNV